MRINQNSAKSLNLTKCLRITGGLKIKVLSVFPVNHFLEAVVFLTTVLSMKVAFERNYIVN